LLTVAVASVGAAAKEKEVKAIKIKAITPNNL
jgi:hypothetical protein